MGENNKLKGTVEELFRGMDGVISSKTVVGDANSYWRYDHTSVNCVFIWYGSGLIQW